MIAPFSFLHGARSEDPLPSASFPTELLRHTESLVLLHTDPSPPSPTKVFDASKETDLVLTQLKLVLPPPPEVEVVEPLAEGEEAPQPPVEPSSFEALLVSGESAGDVERSPPVPLDVSASGEAMAARPIKGRSREGVRLEVREVGSETALWASAPLASLGLAVAGAPGAPQAFGKLQPSPADDEEATALRALAPTDAAPTAEDGSPQTASIASCGWRLQRALPPVVKFRTRPQALFYSASNDRGEFEERLNLWRRELKENQLTKPAEVRAHIRDSPWRPLEDSVRTIPQSPSKWTQPWRPPPPPHHLRGDPLTRRKNVKYIADAAQDAKLLSAQAVVVQLERLYGAVPICATADQACGALESLHEFVQSGDHLIQIDALKLLKKVKALRLPFERLGACAAFRSRFRARSRIHPTQGYLP